MPPSKGNKTNAANTTSPNDATQEDLAEEEEFTAEKQKQIEEEAFTVEKTEEFTDEKQIVEETHAVGNEISSIYQKLLDGKESFVATDDHNEFKDVMSEAKDMIWRVKDTRGAIENATMYRLLCHKVSEMSEDTNTNKLKFLVEDYVQNLNRKFNFSTNNSSNIIVTKLQLVSLGKENSKYFVRAPTLKLVLGAEHFEVRESTAIINNLPNELLTIIFRLLSPLDLKIAVLVCRRWRKVGEHPDLWKWSFINIRGGEDIIKLSVVARVQYIYVNPQPQVEWQAEQLEQILKSSLELPKLKAIGGLEWIDLRSINSELVGNALGKLEKLWIMAPPHTTNDQRNAIFNSMAQNGLIKNLTVSYIDLRTLALDEGVLAKVLSGLELLILDYVSLTNDQTQQVFKLLFENDQLNWIYFSNLNLFSVESEMFGSALNKVENVTVNSLDISPHQTQTLFAQMGQNSKIKSFAMTGNDLSDVEPKLFARGISKLEKVDLEASNLTNEQVLELFAKLKLKCKLSDLTLDSNDLSAVDADDLATVVTNIKQVSLRQTQLNTEQITSLLTRPQENTKLKGLCILGNSISQVQPDIIARAKEIIDVLDINESDTSESEQDESDTSESEEEVSDTESESEQDESDTESDSEGDVSVDEVILDGIIASASNIDKDEEKNSDA